MKKTVIENGVTFIYEGTPIEIKELIDLEKPKLVPSLTMPPKFELDKGFLKKLEETLRNPQPTPVYKPKGIYCGAVGNTTASIGCGMLTCKICY